MQEVDEVLQLVLAYEILFGKGVRCGGKLGAFSKQNRNQLCELLDEFQRDETNCEESEISKHLQNWIVNLWFRSANYYFCTIRISCKTHYCFNFVQRMKCLFLEPQTRKHIYQNISVSWSLELIPWEIYLLKWKFKGCWKLCHKIC